MTDETAPAGSAFEFTGGWREFAPIAFTNLLLTIVTLGIYRFWAKTRERRYLWSRTNFIGDPLEWTGTGKELFIGFILVLILLGPPILFLQFGAQALMLRGHIGATILLTLLAYVAILYFFGVARFRAIRYRLSRSYWRGIRGGSDDRGWDYGLESLWRSLIGGIVLGLMIPWSMTTLWNRRWGRMSFGANRFAADASWEPIMGRYMLFYLLPIVGCMGIIGVSAVTLASGGTPGASGASILFAVLGVLAAYAGMGVIAIVYYAAFLREAVGSLTLHEVRFEFTARTKDWILLLLGNFGLIIITLGIGYIFLSYRNWAFMMRHLEASGEIDLAALTQSTTSSPTQGEGLLDAFDVGAF